MDINKKQLEVIEAMRFPLIFLVFFIHMLPEASNIGELQFSSMGFYRVFSEMISHTVGSIAVPCFFLFSGFLFFYKMDENQGFNFYWTVLQKRFRTVFIPYVLWIVLNILAIIVKNYVFHLFGLESDESLLAIKTQSWYELFWVTPVDYPLWYMRDLMCMIVIAPLFFFLFRYTKVFGLVLLLLVYLSGLDTGIPGFSVTAILFSGCGAFLSLNKKNILLVCSKFRKSVAVLSLVLLCLATYYSGTAYYIYLLRAFIVLGIITAINSMNWLVRYEKWKEILCRLSVTTFFVYAIHEIYIINWLKGGFSRTALADSGWGMILGYLLIPCICMIVCLILYFILLKVSPRLLSVLTGGRIASRNNYGKNK